MHSNGRFKGKLTERWGRKASGLRDESAYDSGVAGSNVNPLARKPQSAPHPGSADPRNRAVWRVCDPTPVSSRSHRSMRLLDDKFDMAQHILFTSNSDPTADRGMASLRETRSSSNGAVPHTTLLCDEPHVLFNNALLYSGDRFSGGVSVFGRNCLKRK
jgi:hypothetical protein